MFEIKDLKKCLYLLVFTIFIMSFSTNILAETRKIAIGMNLAAIEDWSSAFPFLNLVKQARPWISQQEGSKWGKGEKLNLDKSGWVKSLKKGQSADLIVLTIRNNVVPYKTYRVMFDGDGEIQFRGAKIVKKNKKNNIIVKLNQSTSYFIIRIKKTNPDNYIRDVSVVPVEFVENYDRGEIFNPEYLQILRPFMAIRFMNWMKTNSDPPRPGSWKERPKMTDASWAWKGVPVEVMTRLANRLKADPWFNMPHTSDREYILNFAKYLKNNLDSGLDIYVEHSNEVWNGLFPQTHYAREKAKLRWGNANYFTQWHGMRTAQICDIWKKEVFKSEANKIHCVFSTWTARNGLEKQGLECRKWVQEGNEPCYKHGIDSLGITGYFSGCLHGKTKNSNKDYYEVVRHWATEGQDGIRKGIEEILDGRHFECSQTLITRKQKYQYYANSAKSYGLSLVAYEGGSHVTTLGTGRGKDKVLVKYLRDINLSPLMKNVYYKNLEIWKNSGGTLFMHFVEINNSSRFGNFGAMENLRHVNAPKYKALIQFGLENKCWWNECKKQERTKNDHN